MGELKLRRKLFRMVGLLFPALYVAGDRAAPGAGWIAAVGVIVLFLGVMIPLEYARFRSPGVNRWLFDRFRAYTKEKERARTSSTTLFLAACLVTLLVFGKGVAMAAMLMLVFGDPVAEIVGTRWGRTPLLGKSLEGTLGGLCACLAAASPIAAADPHVSLSVLLAGAAAASLAELAPLPIDDNFTIPLAAGIAMTAAAALGAGSPPPLSPLLGRLLGGTAS